MKSIICFFLLVIFSTELLKGQEDIDTSNYAKKAFCIILSTKKYSEAKRVAEQAAKKLNIETDYRKLTPYKKIGLTMSKSECEDNGFEFPAYISRGRYEDGEYISIEYSDAFSGFAKGYYIVVAYSGAKEDGKSTLNKVKKTYKTAYIKESYVYMGCMH